MCFAPMNKVWRVNNITFTTVFVDSRNEFLLCFIGVTVGTQRLQVCLVIFPSMEQSTNVIDLICRR